MRSVLKDVDNGIDWNEVEPRPRDGTEQPPSPVPPPPPAAPAEPPPAPEMGTVVCPHCEHAREIEANAEPTEYACEGCGKAFQA